MFFKDICHMTVKLRPHHQLEMLLNIFGLVYYFSHKCILLAFLLLIALIALYLDKTLTPVNMYLFVFLQSHYEMN